MIPEDTLAYTHLVAFKKLVARLLERIGLVFEPTAKLRWSLVVFVEELLIPKVYTFYHILQCLGRQQAPVRKACGLFQFGEVSHEPILARILAEPLIIPLVKGNEMIIHTCKGVYISVEILVAITSTIQLVFIGQIHGQPPKK